MGVSPAAKTMRPAVRKGSCGGARPTGRDGRLMTHQVRSSPWHQPDGKTRARAAGTRTARLGARPTLAIGRPTLIWTCLRNAQPDSRPRAAAWTGPRGLERADGRDREHDAQGLSRRGVNPDGSHRDASTEGRTLWRAPTALAAMTKDWPVGQGLTDWNSTPHVISVLEPDLRERRRSCATGRTPDRPGGSPHGPSSPGPKRLRRTASTSQHRPLFPDLRRRGRRASLREAPEAWPLDLRFLEACLVSASSADPRRTT